jgi:hypothetical protein
VDLYLHSPMHLHSVVLNQAQEQRYAYRPTLSGDELLTASLSIHPAARLWEAVDLIHAREVPAGEPLESFRRRGLRN